METLVSDEKKKDDQKGDQKPKVKTYTEEELNKELTSRITSAKTEVPKYTMSRKRGNYPQELHPVFNLVVEGGDEEKFAEMAGKIEKIVIEFINSK